MLFDEKTVSIMAYSLETIIAEKYETIIRRNIGSTRARDYYDLHTLFRSRNSEIRSEILKAAVLHTAKKRDSVQDIEDCRILLKILEKNRKCICFGIIMFRRTSTLVNSNRPHC